MWSEIFLEVAKALGRPIANAPDGDEWQELLAHYTPSDVKASPLSHQAGSSGAGRAR